MRRIRRGYIKGIIGLPANLFYGTGIPACIIIIDKENAEARKDIIMIDASKGFMKDGNKNRLREQDIHKIVDVFNKQLEIPKYSRMVSFDGIEKNEYNLNIPRYIDSQEAEDIQDIEAHLRGGIPERDIDDLNEYWEVYPSLRTGLFATGERKGYLRLNIDKDKIKQTIFHHSEFTTYRQVMQNSFDAWKNDTSGYLKQLEKGVHPKRVIYRISEHILAVYQNIHLIDKYDIYQHLMNYWAETMQDDLYELAADGWKAGNEVIRLVKKGKDGKKDREVEGITGLEGRLIPPLLMIEAYFNEEKTAIDELEVKKETVSARMEELREEYGDDEGLLTEVMDDKGKISKKNPAARIKELGKKTPGNAEEWELLQQYNELMDTESELDGKIKQAWKELEIKVIKQYPTLTIDEIKTVVVGHKWMASIEKAVHTETDRISQRLAGRIKELAERYESTLPQISAEVAELEKKVEAHLGKMGLAV